MKLELRLFFYRENREPVLVAVALREMANSRSPWHQTTNYKLFPDERSFQWRTGPKALSALFLLRKAGVEPGGYLRGPIAETLAGALRKRTRWLQDMFSVNGHAVQLLEPHYRPSEHASEIEFLVDGENLNLFVYLLPVDGGLRESPLRVSNCLLAAESRSAEELSEWQVAPSEMRDMAADIMASLGRKTLVKLKVAGDFYDIGKQIAALEAILENLESRAEKLAVKKTIAILRRSRRGSVEFEIIVSAAEAEILEDIFKRRDSGVEIVELEIGGGARAVPTERGVELNLAERGQAAQLENFIKSQVLRQTVVDSFVFLPIFLFGKACKNSDAETAARSDDISFAGSISRGDRHWLKLDLIRGFLCWPLLTIGLFSLLSTLLPGESPIIGIIAYLTGAMLSVSGSLICSSVVSCLGCAAGGIFICLAFALSHGMIIAEIGLSPFIHHFAGADAFTRIVGGIIGVAASHPKFGALGHDVIVGILLSTGVAIALSADLMAAPSRLRAASSKENRRPLLGAVMGSMVGGAMIGANFGLTRLLGLALPDTIAFSISFLILGTLAFAFCIRLLRNVGATRTKRFAAVYAGGLLLLLIPTFHFSGSFVSILTGSMATGVFHATWFALSFLVGKYFGGLRAAVWAAVMEGMVGYLVFVCVQAIRQPWWIPRTVSWTVWALVGLVLTTAIIAAVAYAVVMRDQTRCSDAK